MALAITFCEADPTTMKPPIIARNRLASFMRPSTRRTQWFAPSAPYASGRRCRLPVAGLDPLRRCPRGRRLARRRRFAFPVAHCCRLLRRARASTALRCFCFSGGRCSLVQRDGDSCDNDRHGGGRDGSGDFANVRREFAGHGSDYRKSGATRQRFNCESAGCAPLTNRHASHTALNKNFSLIAFASELRQQGRQPVGCSAD